MGAEVDDGTIPAELGQWVIDASGELHQGVLHRPGAGGPHRQPGRQRPPPPAGPGRRGAPAGPGDTGRGRRPGGRSRHQLGHRCDRSQRGARPREAVGRASHGRGRGGRPGPAVDAAPPRQRLTGPAPSQGVVGTGRA